MSLFTSSSDQRAWRRFFARLTGTVAVLTGVIYLFTVIVDPFDILPLSPHLDRAPVTSNQRFAYPALARSALFDSAVFGTSTSRLLRPPALNGAFRARFANLAMNAATPFEQLSLISVFLRAHPNPRAVVLGIDASWCVTGDLIPRLTPRPFPAWMYQSSPWRGYREMLNLFAIQEAVKEFGVLTGLKAEDMGRDGYSVFVPPDEKYDPVKAAANLRADGVTIPAGARPGPAASWRFTAFEDLLPVLAGVPRDADIVLFFVPYHRVRLPSPDHPGFEIWDECKRRAVAAANGFENVLVVDFMKPSPITNDDAGYWDAQHYRVGVADRVARGLAEASRGLDSEDYAILLRRRHQ